MVAIAIDKHPSADLAGAQQFDCDVDLRSWYDGAFLFIGCPALIFLVLLQDCFLKIETMKGEFHNN